MQTNIKTSEETLQNECKIEEKSKEKCGKVLEKEVKKVCLTTQTSQSINLTSQTNISKEQKPPRTALQTNINQEFQQPSLF